MKFALLTVATILTLAETQAAEALPLDVQTVIDRRNEAVTRIETIYQKELERLRASYIKQGNADVALRIDSLAKGINAVESDAISPTYLDDLNEFDVTLGWGKVGKHGDGPEQGSAILVRGLKPKNSIVAHPPETGSAFLSYRLDGNYSLLTGSVTVPDGFVMQTPITFRILGDDKVLWKSHSVTDTKDAQNFSIPVKDVKILKLETNSRGVSPQAWAVWLGPCLSK